MKLIEELETFHFTDLEMNDEQAEFASALKLIIEGKDELAAESLKHLFFNSHDPILRSNCSKLLFDLYFAKSDWKQIELLCLLDEPSIEKTNRLIAKTCSNQSKKTTFSFSIDQICVPMKQSISGSPTIEVIINGNKKWFWLDTGAGMTVISSSIAKDCHISSIKDKEFQVENSISQNFSTDLAFIDSIVIKDLSIQNHPTLVLSDDLLKIHNPNTKEVMVIDGIIGWDIIQHIFLEIDYQQNQVTIQKPKQKDNLNSNLFFCGYPIWKVKAKNQVPLYFGLDTGASKTHFGQPLLSKIGDLKIEKSLIHAGGIGDVKEKEIDSIESLIVYLNEDQPISLHNVSNVLADYATFFKLDGVFGSDIAKDGRLIIDYANRNLSLHQ
ncbi:MAG TPA: pepsin/retropepsin-like aspartic protease family protein [Rummeliibacillus sp.]|nr:pepsin/retropepsin-like aspartic protease family protein [Rummeliibacillus sp.]